MGTFRSILLLASLLISVSATANLPKNNLHLLDRAGGPSNITEAQFNKITDDIIAIWKPLAKLHGADLVAVKDWNDSTVNAYADQSGKTWTVHMFGGLARRPEVTADGYALVVCHELGHHFAGHYFYNDSDWASAEGQSDYFATQVCARRIFASARRVNHLFDAITPASVKERCDKAWKEAPAQELCYRTSAAGYSLANLLATIGRGGKIDFDTPDKTVVSRTQDQHPQAQCRLDTYFAGALCTAPFKLEVIPGKEFGKSKNQAAGEKASAAVSCTKTGGFEQGTRPLCWFKPTM